MTEETPKKPRRKRRTKAQIEAEKAAELAAKEVKEEECIPCKESAAAALEAAEAALEKEVEIDAISEEVVSEEPVVSAERTVYEEPETTPATYANPNMELIANRWKRKRAERKAKLK